MPDDLVEMSGPAPTESKSKKKRKNKKKANTNTYEENSNGVVDPNRSTEGVTEADKDSETSDLEAEDKDVPPSQDVGVKPPEDAHDIIAHTNGISKPTLAEGESEDASARFDALVRDRDALREEVTQLRQSIEGLQAKHQEDVDAVQNQLQETQGEKEHAEEQYQSLLGKVNTIRSQLGERLKADAEDLAQARTRIEELEEQKSELQEQYTSRSAEVEELTSKTREQESELNNLRSRATLSQQNWIKEREELVDSEAYIREEFENAKQAMHDWEVLAMEERQIRRDLSERVSDLEEQLASAKTDYQRAASDRDSQSGTVDGLQRALQELQEARRRELRELVETTSTETQNLRKELEDIRTENESHKRSLEETSKELERALPFEKEVKEKNLLIGKLRHEAVILNDHLTKALRFLKKGKPEDNVDRQIVTNHVLHFLALDRSDPKKFQVLQVIASLLGWTDEQKEQAGLARPGASSVGSMVGSLRLPTSPLVHRTPSTPAFGTTEYFGSNDGARSPESKESLAELWQNFLEQEASQQSKVVGGPKS